MKKLLAIFPLLFFIYSLAITQVKEKDQSNAERFSAKPGTLLQKEFVGIGSVKDVKLEVMLLTDLISGSKSSGLRFEFEHAGQYSTGTKVAVLDPDEVEGLMKSISIFQNKIFNTKRTNYTEVNFFSRGGFEAGCYNDLNSNTWKTFLKLEKFDNDSYVWLDIEDFSTLLNLLTQAKAKL